MRDLCVPLCGASKAYGRFAEPWKHEPQCPVRIAWERAREIRKTLAAVSVSGGKETQR